MELPAFGLVMFDPAVSPDYLYRSAQQAPDSEQREALEQFAADLAAIRALPETDAVRAVL